MTAGDATRDEGCWVCLRPKSKCDCPWVTRYYPVLRASVIVVVAALVVWVFLWSRRHG